MKMLKHFEKPMEKLQARGLWSSLGLPQLAQAATLVAWSPQLSGLESSEVAAGNALFDYIKALFDASSSAAQQLQRIELVSVPHKETAAMSHFATVEACR